VPDIIKVFINNGQELPVLTTLVLALSNWVTQYGLYAALTIGLIIVGFRYGMTREGFRLNVHRQILHAPFLAKMSRGINTARYASTLSILNSSGVPLVDAMRIAGEVLGNQFLKLKVADAAQKVKEGGSLHKSLEQTGYFPPMMIHMIASGEASGELDAMLERTANNQESDLQAKIATMVGLFEPLMLLVMGGIVLVIVMAIMQPILTMTDLVG
jgi:general secretion pathway protein F